MQRIFKVDKTSINMRIDKWIKINIGKLPQSLIEKELRKGNVKINNKKVKSSIKLKINDEIKFYKFKYNLNFIESKKKFTPSIHEVKENENLIIDNRENFIVINKKPGIPVQGGTKSKKNIIDLLSKSKIFNESKPYPVHRIDKDTSGALMIAKNRDGAKFLTSLFRIRKIHKTYLAICEGEVEKVSGELNHNLIRYEGKKKIIENAITNFLLIDKNQGYSFLKLNPITGRKHQIRKQLNLIGHTICGDKKYFSNVKIKNLMLHSYEIKFKINNRKLTFRASLPNYFENYLKVKRLKSLKN